MRKRLVTFAAAAAICASGAAAAAPPASAGTWCYDSYWGWYYCSFSYVVSAVQPVTQAIGILPSPASVTGLLLPPPPAAN